MEKAYAETNAGESAVPHHPLESSGTRSNALGEFFEVRPPAKIRKERRTRGTNQSNKSSFPWYLPRTNSRLRWLSCWDIPTCCALAD